MKFMQKVNTATNVPVLLPQGVSDKVSTSNKSMESPSGSRKSSGYYGSMTSGSAKNGGIQYYSSDEDNTNIELNP